MGIKTYFKMGLRFYFRIIRYRLLILKKRIVNKAPYPKIFMVETYLGCNLKCPECACGGDFITRKKGAMTFEDYKIIADKIKPYAEYVYLHLWGEPLLNKDIFKIIEYTSKFSRTNISTNGMVVDKEIAEKLITSGVTDVIVSIDGVSQEVYEKYRKAGDVNKAKEALKLIVEANKRHGNPVRIYPQFVVFEHNQSEMDGFRKLCNSLGVEPVFKPPYIRKESIFNNSNLTQYIRKPFTNKKEYENAIVSCGDFTDTFVVDVTGNVVLCCYDANSEIVFGNMFDQSVDEIYYGKKHADFVKSVKEGGKAPEFCKENCLLYLCES